MDFFTFFEKEAVVTVFKWLSGLSASDFSRVLEFVIQAEREIGQGKGEQKRQWVVSQLETLFNNALPHVLNFAVEIVVAYAKADGILPK